MPERLTREQLLSVFGEKAVTAVSPVDLPEGVTHEFTRDFLSEVGVPMATSAEFISFDGHVPTGPMPLRDSPLHTEIGRELPLGSANFYYLGDAYGAVFVTIALDGTTGKIYAISEAEQDPYLMNSDIESLVFFMYTLDRNKNLYSDDYYDEHNSAFEGSDTDTYAEAAKLIEHEWREHDPAPLEIPEGDVMRVWPNVLDDIASGMRG
jgi:hypothetical protein